jgi:hypothetical protein
MCGVQFKCAGNGHGPCFWDVKVVAPIVVHGGSTVPCINSLLSPKCACEWAGVYDGARAWWCQGVRVPIIFVAVQLFVSGYV